MPETSAIRVWVRLLSRILVIGVFVILVCTRRLRFGRRRCRRLMALVSACNWSYAGCISLLVVVLDASHSRLLNNSKKKNTKSKLA